MPRRSPSVYYKGERICAGVRSYKDAIKEAKEKYKAGKITLEEFNEIFEKHTNERIIIATFASNIYRLKHIVETCYNHKK